MAPTPKLCANCGSTGRISPNPSAMTNADATSTHSSRGMRTAAGGWVTGVADTIHQYAVPHRRPEPHRPLSNPAAARPGEPDCPGGRTAWRLSGRRSGRSRGAVSGARASSAAGRTTRRRSRRGPARPSGMPQVCSRSSHTAPRLGTGSPCSSFPAKAAQTSVPNAEEMLTSSSPAGPFASRTPPSVMTGTSPRHAGRQPKPSHERNEPCRPARVGLPARRPRGTRPAHRSRCRRPGPRYPGSLRRSLRSTLRRSRSLDPSGDTEAAAWGRPASPGHDTVAPSVHRVVPRRQVSTVNASTLRRQIPITVSSSVQPASSRASPTPAGGTTCVVPRTSTTTALRPRQRRHCRVQDSA